MINYLIVIFGNYDLLDLQIKNFKRRLPNKDYRLIVVDNTLNENKKTFEPDPIIDIMVSIDSHPAHDGVSHGNAINIGLSYINSGIVSIIDSDFFLLDNNIHDYVREKFDQGYLAVGCEYNDGRDTKNWVNINPANFKNIPCCFGAYYNVNLAKSQSWIITAEEVNQNRSTGFVEVGYRIRKHILENKIKTYTWKTDATDYGKCFFRDGERVMGMHYVAGSHRRWNMKSKEEIENIISSDYNNFRKITECLCCGNKQLDVILDLKDQPLANSYTKTKEEFEYKYPLAINYCEKCTHVQLTHRVNPDLLFKDYLYVSGTTKTLKDYFDWFVDYTTQFGDGSKTVLDIACNDGTQLDAYKKKGYTTYGVDPAENLFPTSSKNHNVWLGYFDRDYVDTVNTKFDIITAQNVFAHNDYPLEFLKFCKEILNDNGHVFIQTSQADMIKNNQFDTIYHEHISFFSVESFCALAKRAGLVVRAVERTPVHGTSFVFVLSKTGEDNSDLLIAQEGPRITYKNMLQYAMKCNNVAEDTYRAISDLKRKGYKVIGYGAAAKGNTFLNYSGILLDYIVDDNPLKVGLYTPGNKVPIYSPDMISQEGEPVCVVPLAWNFFKEIKNKVLQRKTDNIIFFKYFPEQEVINA